MYICFLAEVLVVMHFGIHNAIDTRTTTSAPVCLSQSHLTADNSPQLVQLKVIIVATTKAENEKRKRIKGANTSLSTWRQDKCQWPLAVHHQPAEDDNYKEEKEKEATVVEEEWLFYGKTAMRQIQGYIKVCRRAKCTWQKSNGKLRAEKSRGWITLQMMMTVVAFSVCSGKARWWYEGNLVKASQINGQ